MEKEIHRDKNEFFKFTDGFWEMCNRKYIVVKSARRTMRFEEEWATRLEDDWA